MERFLLSYHNTTALLVRTSCCVRGSLLFATNTSGMASINRTRAINFHHSDAGPFCFLDFDTIFYFLSGSIVVLM